MFLAMPLSGCEGTMTLGEVQVEAAPDAEERERCHHQRRGLWVEVRHGPALSNDGKVPQSQRRLCYRLAPGQQPP